VAARSLDIAVPRGLCFFSNDADRDPGNRGRLLALCLRKKAARQVSIAAMAPPTRRLVMARTGETSVVKAPEFEMGAGRDIGRLCRGQRCAG